MWDAAGLVFRLGAAAATSEELEHASASASEHSENPSEGGGEVLLPRRPGDWICPDCGNLVFVHKSVCGKPLALATGSRVLCAAVRPDADRLQVHPDEVHEGGTTTEGEGDEVGGLDQSLAALSVQATTDALAADTLQNQSGNEQLGRRGPGAAVTSGGATDLIVGDRLASPPELRVGLAFLRLHPGYPPPAATRADRPKLCLRPGRPTRPRQASWSGLLGLRPRGP